MISLIFCFHFFAVTLVKVHSTDPRMQVLGQLHSVSLEQQESLTQQEDYSLGIARRSPVFALFCVHICTVKCTYARATTSSRWLFTHWVL